MPPDEDGPLATLAHNTVRQVRGPLDHLQATPGRCPFPRGLDRLHLPVAHGEGRSSAARSGS